MLGKGILEANQHLVVVFSYLQWVLYIYILSLFFLLREHIFHLAFFVFRLLTYVNIQAVYFDYLVLDSAFLEPTLPRIRVWDDNAISSNSGAELGIQNIEVFLISISFFSSSFLFFWLSFHHLIFISCYILFPFLSNSLSPWRRHFLISIKWPLRQFVDLTSLVGISLPSSQHPTLPAMLPTINLRYVTHHTTT